VLGLKKYPKDLRIGRVEIIFAKAFIKAEFGKNNFLISGLLFVTLFITLLTRAVG